MTTSLQARPVGVAIDGSERDETWHADIVDGGRVNARLTGQWLRLLGPRPQRLGGVHRPDDGPDAAASAPGTYARTNTTNLVVSARSRAQADRAARALSGFRGHFPTRAITVVADPALDRRSGGSPEAGLLELTTRLVRPDTGARNVGHFESVTVTGGLRQLGNPTNTGIPLCVPDLPIVLWWTGDLQYDLGVFRDLSASSDRVVLDSAVFGDVARGLSNLASVVSPVGSEPLVLVDLAWSRLRDWRNLIAQFYDAPPDPDALANVEAVEVEYVVDPEEGTPSGQSSAHLLTGWLASRLGWELSQPVERIAGGLQLVFLAHSGRTVTVQLLPVNGRVTTSGIVSVTVRSAGEACLTCRVEQFSETELVTTSTVDSLPPMTRYVVASASDDAALLELVLQEAARDRIFEDALTDAVDAFSRR